MLITKAILKLQIAIAYEIQKDGLEGLKTMLRVPVLFRKGRPSAE